jgi:hypothetical protein
MMTGPPKKTVRAPGRPRWSCCAPGPPRLAALESCWLHPHSPHRQRRGLEGRQEEAVVSKRYWLARRLTRKSLPGGDGWSKPFIKLLTCFTSSGAFCDVPGSVPLSVAAVSGSAMVRGSGNIVIFENGRRPTVGRMLITQEGDNKQTE